MVKTRRLIYTFNREDDKKMRYTVNRIRPNVSNFDVETFGSYIVDYNIFSPEILGSRIVSVDSIESITTDVRDFNITA